MYQPSVVFQYPDEKVKKQFFAPPQCGVKQTSTHLSNGKIDITSDATDTTDAVAVGKFDFSALIRLNPGSMKASLVIRQRIRYNRNNCYKRYNCNK
jgi:hypothetical protein